MSSSLEFRYRLVYESLAKLTTQLSHSGTLQEVQQCLQRNLKYVFDCQLVRFCYYQRDLHIVNAIYSAESTLEKGTQTLLWRHELELQKQDVPVVLNDFSQMESPLQGHVALTRSDTLWGWHFAFGETSGMIVSVFSGQNKVFTQSDIPVLKIVAESLYSRIFTISVIHELDQRKWELQQALEDVQEKNQMVTQLMQQQEDVIRKRTRQLQEKSEKLLELSKLNAHSVREPLSRILGLIQVAELLYTGAVPTDWLSMLQASSQDLDTALKNVIQLTDQEIVN